MPYCLYCNNGCRTSRPVYDETTNEIIGYKCADCDPDTRKKILERNKQVYNTPEGKAAKLLANKKASLTKRDSVTQKDIDYVNFLLIEKGNVTERDIEFLDSLLSKLKVNQTD